MERWAAEEAERQRLEHERLARENEEKEKVVKKSFVRTTLSHSTKPIISPIIFKNQNPPT